MALDYDGRLHLRRAFGVVVPLVLLGSALVLGTGDRSSMLSDALGNPGPTATPSVTPSVTLSLAPSVTPSLSPTIATPSTGPTVAFGATPPPSPSSTATASVTSSVPLVGVGIVLAVSPTSGGAIEVSERVRLAKKTQVITLAPPEVAAAGTDFAGLAPRAVMVQLMVDGQPVPVPSATVEGAVAVPLSMPTDSFELRYVLENTTVRSIPSSSGRALAAVAPLSRNSDPEDTVVLEAATTAVRNLSCPEVDQLRMVCAEGDQGRLRTRSGLRAINALVVLQTDLPRP